MTTLSSLPRCLFGFILATFAIVLFTLATAPANAGPAGGVDPCSQDPACSGSGTPGVPIPPPTPDQGPQPERPKLYPSKLEVLRAGIKDGRLDVYAEVSARANGDAVKVDYHANGRHTKFTQTIQNGRLRIDRKLPKSQSRYSTGIVTLTYEGGRYGNDYVRATEVRMRAASGKARLTPDFFVVGKDGRLQAGGTVAKGARGVMRFNFSWDHHDNGKAGEWEGQVDIYRDRNGVQQWVLEPTMLPSSARGAVGYLTVQYTGYLPKRIRGEQVAKQLVPGELYEWEGEPRKLVVSTPPQYNG